MKIPLRELRAQIVECIEFNRHEFDISDDGERITVSIGGSNSGRGEGAGVFCPFGEIIPIPDSDPPATGIRGGICYCGDMNFNVEPWEIDLGTSGVWLVFLTVDCESQRDDDGEIFLPGLVTSTSSAGDLFTKIAWSDPTDYPANTNPDVSDGIGTVIVPLGKLRVEDGAATFEKAGCGNARINQCAGILSASRE